MRKVLIITTMLLAAAALAGAQERLADQLKKGIVHEEANQDVAKAIQAYQSIVAQFDEDRKTAGTALYRLAECYRRTGKREQAVASYQRVVREFADQPGLVEPSRRQLATLGVTETRAGRDNTETAQLRRELFEAQKQLEAARLIEASREPRLKRPANGGTAVPDTPEMVKVEIRSLEATLADARRRVEMGVLPTTAVRELETQLEMARARYQQAVKELEAHEQERQNSRALAGETLRSVEAEVKLVSQQIQALEEKIAIGAMSRDDASLLQLRRDLLELERKAREIKFMLMMR